jgi:hypothetical protein
MYRLEGNYRQIGAEYGLLLRTNRIPLPLVSKTRLDFARACEPFVRDYAPELLDEIEGIAEGGGYDLDRIKAAALAPGARPACSVLAISGAHTASGRPLVGRNYDWFPSALGYTAFCEVHPHGAIPSLGCNDMFVGRMDGLNAAGVAVAITAVEGGRDQPGLMFLLAVRVVLDRCRSTQDAVDFLLRVRHARAINFLVADASGDLAAVEAAPCKAVVRRSDNGVMVVTNQFQSEDMARMEKVYRRPPNSYPRLCALREWFAGQGGPITAGDVQAILSLPYPRGVCVLSMTRRGVRTVWSWTAELGTGEYAFAIGSPLESPYRTYTLA